MKNIKFFFLITAFALIFVSGRTAFAQQTCTLQAPKVIAAGGRVDPSNSDFNLLTTKISAQDDNFISVGTQDGNNDNNWNDPIGGWVVIDFGCFYTGAGPDLTEWEYGKNEGGQIYFGVPSATIPTNPDPNTGNPNAFGWNYVPATAPPHKPQDAPEYCDDNNGQTIPEAYNHGLKTQWACWTGSGPNDVDINPGQTNQQQYRYIYFWSDGSPYGDSTGGKSDPDWFHIIYHDPPYVPPGPYHALCPLSAETPVGYASRTLVDFNDRKIGAWMGSASTDSVAQQNQALSLPAEGDYELTLVAWDNHTGMKNCYLNNNCPESWWREPNERYHLVIYDSEGIPVNTTEDSEDLGDDSDLVITKTSRRIPGPAIGTVRPFHSEPVPDESSHNSIVAVCAAFDKLLPPHDSSCDAISISPDTNILKGGQFSGSVIMRNTGSWTWTDQAPDPVRILLGTKDPDNNSRWGPVTVPLYESPNTYLSNPRPVAYGQSAIFNFTATAPTDPASAGCTLLADNNYSCPFNWQMGQAYIKWFGAKCEKNVIVGDPPSVPPPPTLSLSAKPSAVNYNETTNIIWSTHNAIACSSFGGSPGWPAYRPANGIWVTGPLAYSYAYYATCFGQGGTTTAVTLVSVGSAPPDVMLIASPASVPYNGKSTLGWKAANASTCEATGGPWTGIKDTAGNELTVSLQATTTFKITCRNSVGEDSDAVTISVGGGTFGIDLKVNLGKGYVDSGTGGSPLKGVDLKSVTSGTAVGAINYKFYCDSSQTTPTITQTVDLGDNIDVREYLDLCNYESDGKYLAKVEATRSGITARDSAEITVVKACALP